MLYNSCTVESLMFILYSGRLKAVHHEYVPRLRIEFQRFVQILKVRKSIYRRVSRKNI